MTGAKNMRKRLTLKEKVDLIEDSMQLGFKQSKAAIKWGTSPESSSQSGITNFLCPNVKNDQ